MAITREEEIVCLLFSCYAYTPKVKPNINWQIGISSKTVCVIDGIAFIIAPH